MERRFPGGSKLWERWKPCAPSQEFAYENPDYPFPEIAEEDAVFQAEALGHPLLPRKQRVTNDFSLGKELRMIILSGSNMSGKSTFLRTVGVNTVLALAGAPVCAKRLKVSPLTIGASIQILDSIQEGQSRFYSEITRIRKISELTQKPIRVLFLLDEILGGTNSHDRRIGAEAIIRNFIERGAIGITHHS